MKKPNNTAAENAVRSKNVPPRTVAVKVCPACSATVSSNKCPTCKREGLDWHYEVPASDGGQQ